MWDQGCWDTSILRNFENLLKYFTVAWPGSETRNKVFLIIFIDNNYFKKGKREAFLIFMWLDQTQKHEFTMSLHKNYFKKRKYGQSLFKKCSKFQKLDEIWYCGMTRFRNIKLAVFRQYQNTKTVLKKKNMRQSF